MELSDLVRSHPFYPILLRSLKNCLEGVEIGVSPPIFESGLVVGQDPELDEAMILSIQSVTLFSDETARLLDEYKRDSEAIQQGYPEKEAPVVQETPAVALSGLQGLVNFQSAEQKRERLPAKAVNVMREWLFEHVENPFPTNEEKIEIAFQAELTTQQVNQWFVNARRRILKPMAETIRKTSISASDFRI